MSVTGSWERTQGGKTGKARHRDVRRAELQRGSVNTKPAWCLVSAAVSSLRRQIVPLLSLPLFSARLRMRRASRRSTQEAESATVPTLRAARGESESTARSCRVECRRGVRAPPPHTAAAEQPEAVGQAEFGASAALQKTEKKSLS